MECSNNINYIDDLPGELHPLLFSSLDAKSLVRLSQTCSKFKDLISKTAELAIPIIIALAKSDPSKAIDKAQRVENKNLLVCELIKVINEGVMHIRTVNQVDSFRSQIAIRYTLADVEGLQQVAESLVKSFQNPEQKIKFMMEILLTKCDLTTLRINPINNLIRIIATTV